MHDIAHELGVPFISGNVSFYNEWHGMAIPPTPTIMGIGIINDIRKVITQEFKSEGNPIYLIGETRKEMGGSEYYIAMNIEGGRVPRTDGKRIKKASNRILKAMEEGIIKSCHDASNGGIAIALAEMALGGRGAEIDLTSIADMRVDFKLFSESNTRWIVEIDDEAAFLKIFEGMPVYKIGEVGGENLSIYDNGRKYIDVGIEEIRERWRKFSQQF